MARNFFMVSLASTFSITLHELARLGRAGERDVDGLPASKAVAIGDFEQIAGPDQRLQARRCPCRPRSRHAGQREIASRAGTHSGGAAGLKRELVAGGRDLAQVTTWHGPRNGDALQGEVDARRAAREKGARRDGQRAAGRDYVFEKR